MKHRSLLLATAAFVALSSSGFAATKQDDANAKLDALARSVADLDNQIQELKKAQADTNAKLTDDNGAALADLKRSTSDQYVDLGQQITAATANQTKASVDNGRLQVTSADGRFSAALRLLLQYDTAYYSQSHAASLLPSSYAPDLSSGSNFRRVYVGISGKVFGDWTYNANFDFGGSGGTETPGHIQSVYLEYDGLAPWAFRAGAYPPPSNLEDSTASGDTIFLERNAPSDFQRNLAGGDGRDAITLIYAEPTVYGALSSTGDKVQDSAKALAAAGGTAGPHYDEQEGVGGRVAWLPISEDHAHWLVGLNGTYVIKLPELVANGLPNLSN